MFAFCSTTEPRMHSKKFIPGLGKRSAFSLVELVVVVLIIGILAAVAAPRMFNTASDARTNSTRASLVVIRDAIELYRAQQGSYPGFATFARDLKPFMSGPIPSVQITSTNNNNNIRELTGTDPFVATGTQGWAYNATTGEFFVNHADGSGW